MAEQTDGSTDQPSESSRVVGWGFWIGWVLAGAIGWAAAEPVYRAVSPTTGLVGGSDFAGAVGWIVTGVLQWLLLRRQVSRVGMWPFTAVAPGGLLVFTAGADAGWVLLLATSGTIAGLLQWWILKPHIARAGRWVLASTAGWIGGMAAGAAVGWPAGWSWPLIGVVYAALTGSALLLWSREPAAPTRGAAPPVWMMWTKRVFKMAAIVVGVLFVVLIGIAIPLISAMTRDPVAPTYAENCAVCHGENMEGAAQGPALVGAPLVHGEAIPELTRSIAEGFPGRGMPSWAQTMDETGIKALAILIAERRRDLWWNEFKMDKELVIPTDRIETELATFRLETVATGIDPYAFSIAPLPDGRILVTEKKKGVSIVSPDGTRSGPIEGTPKTYDVGAVRWGLDYGVGWHLDVAPHPDYATNGWIYLHHTDVCADCQGFGTKSMNRLVRGRIEDGKWVDQEVIWSVPDTFYNANADLGAGGRIAFDGEGHVYLSVGAKDAPFEAIQDLGTPYGKIHRVHDDGTIPDDNPFVNVSGAWPSIWTYGHRNPQGLEFDFTSGKLWSSEMGPRGGDEINLLQPGRNYGWPLYTLGVDYDGDAIDYLQEAGVAFEDIEQPVVDITPSTAVSSFIIYHGNAFPMWRDHFLVGTLIGTELNRMEIENDRHVHTEVLLNDLARIRDVEMGADGLVYLLLEHESGSRIVRLVPSHR